MNQKIENLDKINTLYIDMDNTYFNSIKAIVDLYNEDFLAYKGFESVEWSEVNSWDFSEYCKCIDNDTLIRYFCFPRFFKKVEPMPWASEVISRLSLLYKIKFVSMGYHPNLKLKKDYINNHFDFIGIDMEKYKDKSHIDMSDGILIDDEMRYLVTSNARYKICFGDIYPWNEKWKGTRCYNFLEIYDILMKQKK